MSTQGPTPPAGWYDDSQDESVQRYWDGSSWTSHTAPAGTIAAGRPPAGRGFGAWWSAQANGVKIALILAAVFVLLLVVSGVAAAARGGQVGASDTANTVPSPMVSNATTPTPTATPIPTPSEEGPDATFFMTEANGNLSDYEKDLGDLTVTLDENGFWRLLSNSVELSFNLGQLQGLDAPAPIAGEWDTNVATLDAQTTVIIDNIGNQQYDTLRADIAAAQATCTSLHAIADRALS